MKAISILLMLLISATIFAQNEEKTAEALVKPRITKTTIIVGGEGADINGFTSQVIQLAVDAVAKTGGTVKLTPGTFEIKTPVRMKQGVNLVGYGNETILKRTNGVQSKFVVDADYGELKLIVENSDGFEIGMKVQVTDEENNSCWNVSTAFITDIQDEIIYVDKGMIRDYRADKNGLISNASSVIDVIEASDVTISNLVADGNREENFFADGCNNAGIMVMRSKNVTIDNVHIKNFNGEGISWQITENVMVKNSEISGSGNTGLHPGTGSPFSVIENNNIHHNDKDGLFICWRVYKSRINGNKIHHNGRFGICTGHKDTDVIFLKNHIFSNGSDGINLRGEREINAPHRNTFEENIIENNSGFGFSVNSPVKDLILKDNQFKNQSGTQKAAIFIYKGGSKPRLENNRFDKHELGEVLVE
jgi:hypothetical protein